jgi:MarR family transcriptional regulator, organic hydroperoxide resistance regulator
MSSKESDISPLYQVMLGIKDLTRHSLIFQHTVADAAGLRVTDAECIDFLQEMGPSTAGELAKATRLTTGAITAMIDRLEKAGFVKRSPDPKDRRKVIVTFLPQKHTGIKQNYGALAKAVQTLLSNYTEEQLKFLATHTQALTEIYKKQTIRIQQHKD